MVSLEHLEPVLTVIDSGADAGERAAAICALAHLDLDEEAWRSVADSLHRALDDPALAGRRREVVDALIATPLRSVHDHLTALASDKDAAGHDEAADALAWVSPDFAVARAKELAPRLASDLSLIRRLAELPLEAAGISLEALRPALDAEDLTTRTYAAIAAGRLGDLNPIDDVLDRLAAGESPEFMYGDPWSAYSALCDVRPVPPALRQHLVARLEACASPTRDFRLLVWAVTGIADAEGDPIQDETAGTPEPQVDSQLVDTVVTTLTEGALDEHGQVTVDWSDLRALGGAAPVEAARVAEAVVAETVGVQWFPGLFPGNAAVQIISAAPTALPLPVADIAQQWNTVPHLPGDQLAWILGRASDDALLDAVGSGIDVELLRDALTARGTPAPIHGAGPGGGGYATKPRRAAPRLIEDLPLAMAEPPDDAPGPIIVETSGGTVGPPRSTPDAFIAESGGEDAEPPPAPSARTTRRARKAARATRHLQVDITDAETGVRRAKAFAPGVRHTVAVHIGPRTRHGMAVESAFPDERVRRDDGAVVLDVELVAETGAGTTHERQQLLLPKEGPTAVLPFTLDVAPTAKEVRFTVLVFQGVRLLQSAEFEGPVSEKDAAVARRTMGVSTTSELETDPLPVPASAELDLSLSFHVGAAGEAMANTGGQSTRVVALAGLDGLTQQIVDVLRDALGSDDVDGASPGSDQQQSLMRQLAQLGNTFFQQLEAQVGPLKVERGVQVTTSDSQVVPIEIVYDHGFPTDTAKLCEDWQQALKTGRCSCKRRTGAVKTVCPLGFWGVRLTVERQLATAGATASAAGNRRPDALSLPPLDRVLFAASAKVDGVSKDERQRTRQVLTERLGDRCVDAESWSAWQRAVKKHRPGLLLALPHNEASDNGLPTLQIGRSSTVHVGALTPKHVLPSRKDAVGPVVMLLGCNTAVSDVPWQSAADAFRRHGASVVIGTLAETLGRQTAPMARLVANTLWGPDAVREQTMGEVMRAVRRRLLLQGATLGMSLVAFGHAGWLVPTPEER